jgi:hypothetical protein
MGEICVECTGEGVVLVDPSGSLPAAEAGRAKTPSVAPSPGQSQTKPPPPPPKPQEAMLDLGDDGDKSASGEASNDEI